MRFIFVFVMILFYSCVDSKEQYYTGSTPAGPVVRSFFEIAETDSIDFMRWKLAITGNRYTLTSNYGIGQPNTNGFIKGGKTIQLKGECKQDNKFYTLLKNGKELRLFKLNKNLLHLVDSASNLLIGNAGWSYVLNSLSPHATSKINAVARPVNLADSMVFSGRTPCGVPGIVGKGDLCYKLKWKLVLYADNTNTPATYKVWGTPWRKENGKTGRWKIRSSKGDQALYDLEDERGKLFVRLLKADENILLFTDENERPLTGNEDFSYILNREN